MRLYATILWPNTSFKYHYRYLNEAFCYKNVPLRYNGDYLEIKITRLSGQFAASENLFPDHFFYSKLVLPIAGRGKSEAGVAVSPVL